MLNISHQSISKSIDKSKFNSFSKLTEHTTSTYLIKILALVFIIGVLCMFLPWTQNIRSKGTVTTLNPFDKPQSIQTLIGGQLEEWHVKEGDLVSLGDTIVTLTEAKEDYLDPDLYANTREQQVAKEKSALAYSNKSALLNSQLVAVKRNQEAKIQQLNIKKQQTLLKIESSEQDLDAANVYVQNASNQLERMELMFDKGIKPLSVLEDKRLSEREAISKRTSIQNKMAAMLNELESINQEIEINIGDIDQKLAKIESEIRTADSYRYSLIGDQNKLQSKLNQLSIRQDAFVIRSPINGRITKILKNGIGEYVKAQESIVTIVPSEYIKAVELYIVPNDMPLIIEGNKVRLQFDGWPAVVFSGWPDNSFGTFGGEVFAIDNDISENGKYRILVIEDDSEKGWPDLIRLGSGAQGLLLLNDVKIYYELWRQLNGFPPDFYQTEQQLKLKQKAPIRKIK